ncbi:unnamed protein product [Schistocephalus solidus]|uniref:Sperm-associated antigen 17 n=1 Tax=Schistocephalus solidus TaxID=70667 RepID=A0A183SQP6_SCHSO|nr:unnamed protein product [Schistocephalus solidus]
MDKVDLTLYDGLIKEELENETWKISLTILAPHQAYEEDLVVGFSKAVLLGNKKSIVSISLETLLNEPTKVVTVRQKKSKRPTSVKAEVEPPSAKEPSRMRKHGAEVDVDDETDDERSNGITQHILLTGFYDPNIIENLISIGVSVHNIIKISVDDEMALKHLVQRKLKEEASLLPVEQVPEAEKIAEYQRTEKQQALNRFWEELEEQLDGQFASGRLRDVVALNYSVRTQILPDTLSDEQAVVDCGKMLYNELVPIIYDLVDFRRQWQNYLAHIKLLAIPRLPESQRRNCTGPAYPADVKRRSHSTVSKARSSIAEEECVEMSTYKGILENYALENIQPELILHAVLEQVVESESGREKVVKKAPSIPEKAVEHISVTVKSLLFEDQQLQVHLEREFLKREEKARLPSPPINAADKLSLRLGSSEDAKITRKSILGLMEATLQTKGCTILAKSENSASDLLDVRTKWRLARNQQLMYFATRQGICDEDLSETLNQLYMESIDLALTSNQGSETPERNHLNSPVLQEKTVELPCRTNPFDDPYIPIPLLAEALLLEEESIIQKIQQEQIDSRIDEVTEPSEFSSSESLGHSARRSRSDMHAPAPAFLLLFIIIITSTSTTTTTTASIQINIASKVFSSIRRGSKSRSSSRKSSAVRFSCEPVNLRSQNNNDDAHSIVDENQRTPLVELLVNQEGLLDPQGTSEGREKESLFHMESFQIKELIKGAQKRDLSNWCLRERLTKDQFTQVINKVLG